MGNQNKQSDEMDRQLGDSGREEQGQQLPGRNPKDDQSDKRTDDREIGRFGENE